MGEKRGREFFSRISVTAANGIALRVARAFVARTRHLSWVGLPGRGDLPATIAEYHQRGPQAIPPKYSGTRYGRDFKRVVGDVVVDIRVRERDRHRNSFIEPGSSGRVITSGLGPDSPSIPRTPLSLAACEKNEGVTEAHPDPTSATPYLCQRGSAAQVSERAAIGVPWLSVLT